ncbi:hypothetical protein FLGE108171_15435 [Flavobacterium gelidilacus]|uniref:hypothetical protein n=1 Tax=Flavobacterium gelidilacus TaxID=206041 RepID=UPI0004243F3E|nr:hypothetical protein [Flavobacterium gelidilacus]
MKTLKYRFIYYFLIILSLSCSKDDEAKTINNSLHPQLANLKKPDVILNNIEKGLFNSNIINSINFQNYNNTPKNWDYEVLENSNRIKSITYSTPYICENTVLSFFYENNLISKIESVRKNVCSDFTITNEFIYNYEQNVLISISAKYMYSDLNISNKLIQVGENFFSYNPTGTIAEIYSDIRPVNEPLVGYQKKSYTYDTDNNVIEVKQEEYNSHTYDKRYIFTYNNKTNPLKGIYLFSGLSSILPNYGFESSLGPIFLSNNCINSVRSEYINLPQNFDDTINFTTNLLNQNIIDFGSSPDYQYWFRNYVN